MPIHFLVMVSMAAAKAALDEKGGVFELRYTDGTCVTGAVASNWEITLNRHPCSVEGGMITALFETSTFCPHGQGVGQLLAELAEKNNLPSDVVDNIRGSIPKTNPGKPVAISGLEWHWDPQSGWGRGADLLRPRAIQFPKIGDLQYCSADPKYIPDQRLFDRLDAIASSPRYGAVLLLGPSGHGKSKGAREWCALRGRPMYEITLGVDTRVEDVVGGVGLENGSTVRRDGLVSILSRPGGTLILNELTAVNQREWTPLWPFLERGQSSVQMVIDGTPVQVPLHPTAMLIATANEGKAIHAEANGGQGFAQLRRMTVIRVEMSLEHMLKVAKNIALQELAQASFSIGDTVVEIPDRSQALDLLDFKRFGKLAARLMTGEAKEVLEVSPELIAFAALDAANPAIGVEESLVSHFVLKAPTIWGQEILAREIVASGLFPEAVGLGRRE